MMDLTVHSGYSCLLYCTFNYKLFVLYLASNNLFIMLRQIVNLLISQMLMVIHSTNLIGDSIL